MTGGVPTLRTRRLRLEPLAMEHADALLDYELRNRAHLRPWEPARSDDYYTISSIRDQIERAVTAAVRHESSDTRLIASIKAVDMRPKLREQSSTMHSTH